MINPNPLTSDQRETFEATGLLRMPGLLPADSVRRAREAVQRALTPLGLWTRDGWRLDAVPRPQWPATGLKTSKVIGNRRPELEALIAPDAVVSVADALLEGHAYDRDLYKRPQLLFTLPNADDWTLPAGWHADTPRLPGGERPGVQLFACLDEVGPRGGGTAVLAGSHRLLNDGRFLPAADMRSRLCQDPFFRDLYAEPSERFHVGPRLPSAVVDGAPLEVVELTGAPGDAWFMDLRVLHTAAPNATDRPRMMITHRFVRADLIAEVAKGYGWS